MFGLPIASSIKRGISPPLNVMGGNRLPPGYIWLVKPPNMIDTIGESTITLTTGTAADLMNASWAFPDTDVMQTLNTLEGGLMFFDGVGAPIVRYGYEWHYLLNTSFVWIGTRGIAGYSTDQASESTAIIRFFRNPTFGPYGIKAQPITFFDTANFWDLSTTGGKAPINAFHRFGAGSVLLSLATTGNARITVTSGFSIDLSGDDLFVLWLYFPNYSRACSFTLYLGQGGLTNYISKSKSPDGQGWFPLILKPSECIVTGAPNLANTFDTIRVRLDSIEVGNAVSCYVDSFFKVTRSRPKIVFTFDDGFATDYSAAYQYMLTKSMVGTSFIITSLVGEAGRLSASQMAEMYADGWDFGNHTHNHTNLQTVDQATRLSEIATARDWLVSNGFPRAANYLAYPYGEYNGSYADLLTTGVISARTTNVEYIETGTGPQSPYLFPYKITADNNEMTLATAISITDTSIDLGKTIIVITHELGTGTGWSVADFQELIDYVAAKRDVGLIDVITFKTLADAGR